MIESKYIATSQEKNVIVKFYDKVINYEVDNSEMARSVSNFFNQKCVLEVSEIWDTIFEAINRYKN